MTIKEEFKLVKKVLRKHGCLRAYRRTLRKEFNRTLLEDVYWWSGGANKIPYAIYYVGTRATGAGFCADVDKDLCEQQSR